MNHNHFSHGRGMCCFGNTPVQTRNTFELEDCHAEVGDGMRGACHASWLGVHQL